MKITIKFIKKQIYDKFYMKFIIKFMKNQIYDEFYLKFIIKCMKNKKATLFIDKNDEIQ